MNAIDLTASQDQIEAILALARQHPDVEDVSEPTNLDASKALNVGLPHYTDIEAGLTFITIVFKTGSAGLMFYKALRAEMKRRNEAIAVSDSATGTLKGKLSGETSDDALLKW